MQGKISDLISLNCVDERYKNSASDSNLNAVGEIRMQGSAHGSCRTWHLQTLSLANARIFQTEY